MRKPSRAKIQAMIEEACVDAYGEEEQVTGFFTMLEDYLALPFKTEMLGVSVEVVELDITDSSRIVAVCRRGKQRQRVPLEDLPLPSPEPEGAAWIAAYRVWAGA